MIGVLCAKRQEGRCGAFSEAASAQVPARKLGWKCQDSKLLLAKKTEDGG